jgi:hypothetical protein
MVDEAAMVDTRNMAMLTAHAYAAGAKLILVGDDRQLSSIERGGMFGVLKDRYGAAELAEVRRQHKNDDRRASELMATGNFHDALARYDNKGAIHWTRTQPEARSALVAQWAKDNSADPSKSRFVFAYTNVDVRELNAAIRGVRKERGELGRDHELQTPRGREDWAAGDRIQFTATDKKRDIYNGNAGTVQIMDDTRMIVRLDGRNGKLVEFDAKEFQDFRHGYAGTIYKGQGRTLDQTYLYHSEHWRSAAGYVALTRHRDKAELFVARNTAPDLKQLARQMARVDDRRAASRFYQADERSPVRPLTPKELAARFDPEGGARRQQEAETSKRQRSNARLAVRATKMATNPSAIQNTPRTYRGFVPPGSDRQPARSPARREPEAESRYPGIQRQDMAGSQRQEADKGQTPPVVSATVTPANDASKPLTVENGKAAKPRTSYHGFTPAGADRPPAHSLTTHEPDRYPGIQRQDMAGSQRKQSDKSQLPPAHPLASREPDRYPGIQRQDMARRQREESDKRQTPGVDAVSRATRAANKAASPLTADERSMAKPAKHRESFTPLGEDRPPNGRGGTHERGGGRGGRTR